MSKWPMYALIVLGFIALTIAVYLTDRNYLAEPWGTILVVAIVIVFSLLAYLARPR